MTMQTNCTQARPGVYEIVNMRTGDKYVGRARQLSYRRSAHLNDLLKGKHHSHKLQSAWDAGNPDDFMFRALVVCAKSEASRIEQALLDTKEYVYNIHPKSTGGAAPGRKCSSASIAKRVVANTGKKRTPEQCARISAALMGKKMTAERRLAIKERTKGQGFPRVAIERAAELRRGTKMPQETIDKKRAAMLGKKPSQETRDKMRAAKIGVKFSEEHKKALSKALIVYWHMAPIKVTFGSKLCPTENST